MFPYSLCFHNPCQCFAYVSRLLQVCPWIYSNKTTGFPVSPCGKIHPSFMAKKCGGRFFTLLGKLVWCGPSAWRRNRYDKFRVYINFKFLLAPYLEQNTVQTLEDFERKVQKDSTNKAKVCLGLCLFLLLSYFLFKMYSMFTKSISDMFSKNFTFLCHLPCPWRKQRSWMMTKPHIFMTFAACGFGFENTWSSLSPGTLWLSMIPCSWKGILANDWTSRKMESRETKLLYIIMGHQIIIFQDKINHTSWIGVGWRQPTLFHWLWLYSHK